MLITMTAGQAVSSCEDAKLLGFAHKAPFPAATPLTTTELQHLRLNGKDMSRTFPCEAGTSSERNYMVFRMEGKIVEHTYSKGRFLKLKLLDQQGDPFYAFVATDACLHEHPARGSLERSWSMLRPRLPVDSRLNPRWSSKDLNMAVSIEGFIYRACDERREPTSPWLAPVTAMEFDHGSSQKLDIRWSKKKG